MIRPLFRHAALAALLASGALHAQQPSPRAEPAAQAKTPANELDAFMQKALDHRAVTRKTLNDYVLDEVETIDVSGPGHVRLYRTRRDFMWYVREGVHVRSPVKYDGVSIPENERRRYEDQWFEREKKRAKHAADKKGKRDASAREADEPAADPNAPPASPQPRFVSDAYFLEFKFEPGNYYLAGRERLESRDVLKIEYYPTRLFDDGPEDGGVKGGRDEPKDAEISRKMNKTSLVTVWVDPAEHQIVKYEFDNVWLDFLPGAWLVRVDDLKASMAMGQPFPGVWLPRSMGIHGGVTLANGSYDVTYSREFANYREANVTTNVRIKPPGDR